MVMYADPERAKSVQTSLAHQDLAALLAWRPAEVVLVTGCYPHQGQTLCLYPRSGRPILYTPAGETPERVPPDISHLDYRLRPRDGLGAWDELRTLIHDDLSRMGILHELIGVGLTETRESLPQYASKTPAIDVEVVRYLLGERAIDASDILHALTQRKTRQEVTAIRRSNAIAGIGLELFFQLLHPSRTEIEIAQEIEELIQTRSGRDGVGFARSWAFVQSGPNASLARQFSRSSDRALVTGDMVILELATCVDGYWSDLTRTGVVGQPHMEQVRMLAAVRDAQAAAIGAVRPRVSHEKVDQMARAVLAERGYRSDYAYAMGHHLGFHYRDHGPLLAPGSTALLQSGMVISVEPAAYDAAISGGVRLEDNLLVTETGAEILSPHYIM